jgi:hypothetical protein
MVFQGPNVRLCATANGRVPILLNVRLDLFAAKMKQPRQLPLRRPLRPQHRQARLVPLLNDFHLRMLWSQDRAYSPMRSSTGYVTGGRQVFGDPASFVSGSATSGRVTH